MQRDEDEQGRRALSRYVCERRANEARVRDDRGL